MIWDRLNTHVSAVMRAFIGAHPGWLTEVRLPAYAPELNPAEGAWAAMKASLGNLAVRDADQLAAIMKNRLKRIQYRPALIEAFLGQAGLTFDPSHRKEDANAGLSTSVAIVPGYHSAITPCRFMLMPSSRPAAGNYCLRQ